MIDGTWHFTTKKKAGSFHPTPLAYVHVVICVDEFSFTARATSRFSSRGLLEYYDREKGILHDYSFYLKDKLPA